MRARLESLGLASALVWYGAIGPVRAHDLHLSHSRVAVEGAKVTVRLRVFQDDIEAALTRARGRSRVRLVRGAELDSLAVAYISSTVWLSVNGARLRPRLLDAGPETEASLAPMWWYDLEYQAAAPVRSLTIQHRLLFEHFADQRNIVTVVREPGAIRHSLYFAAGNSAAQTLAF